MRYQLRYIRVNFPREVRARYWDRTSDPFRVREVRYRCANRAYQAIQLCGGGDGIRTRVNGFAGRCLASRPRHRGAGIEPARLIPKGSCTRADDETRTRDPNLGKVMRYQLRYIRVIPRLSAGDSLNTTPSATIAPNKPPSRACPPPRPTKKPDQECLLIRLYLVGDAGLEPTTSSV